MILSCGESLIDFIPARTATGQPAYRPAVGGSPLNVALTIGRLGVPAGFVGGVSTDLFGDQIMAAMTASRVATHWVTRLANPTTLAFVDLSQEEPRYAFFDSDAAERVWNGAGVELTPEVAALHFGSFSLIRDPAASAYEVLLRRAADAGLLVSLDPNLRPTLVTDEAAYRARLDRLIGTCTLVKISRADLEWLSPGVPIEDVAAGWLKRGVQLVVVTLGGDGATAYRAAGTVHGAAERVTVVDTVGAGDSFMGGLLSALADRNALAPARLAALDDATLRAVLTFAMRVAGRTCARQGADPPWRHELDAAA